MRMRGYRIYLPSEWMRAITVPGSVVALVYYLLRWMDAMTSAADMRGRRYLGGIVLPWGRAGGDEVKVFAGGCTCSSLRPDGGTDNER